MPATPFGEPVVVLLPVQLFVSGNCSLKNASTVALFCCAVCSGLDEPLAMLIEPVPLGLISVIVSESWESTTQPSGSGTARPALEAEVGVEIVGDEDCTGLSEPAGARSRGIRTPGRSCCRLGSGSRSEGRRVPSLSHASACAGWLLCARVCCA